MRKGGFSIHACPSHPVHGQGWTRRTRQGVATQPTSNGSAMSCLHKSSRDFCPVYLMAKKLVIGRKAKPSLSTLALKRQSGCDLVCHTRKAGSSPSFVRVVQALFAYPCTGALGVCLTWAGRPEVKR